jgi:sugar O-acyltransferase (sialic acid O-acetyltransferase NeuD family)
MQRGEPARPLVIVGVGGFSRETAQAVHMCNATGSCWEARGFVDDDPARTGTTVDGLPVLGTIGSLNGWPDVLAVVGTGRPDNYTSRRAIVGRLGLPAARYATIVHPTASLAPTTVLGVGTVILAGSIATASVVVGDHVAVMPGVILTHDDVVDDYATITSGVRLGGGVHVGTGAYIGAGVLVRENVSIGPWAMIGMGSVVTRDVPAGELWLGTPARYLRDAPIPRELLADTATR